MNIKQAKELDLVRIIEIAGGILDESKSHPNQDSYFFKSCLPGRNEATASMHVFRAPNGTWCFKDHGGSKDDAGDIISFARIMSGGTISDGLKWLDNIAGRHAIDRPAPASIRPQPKAPAPREHRYYLEQQKHLFQKPINKNLIAFINARQVDAKIIASYAKEVKFTDQEGYALEAAKHRGQNIAGKRKKQMFGLGLINEARGWEVRTALDSFPKCVVGEKDITIIDNPGLPKRTVHMFEGMFDFFTWMQLTAQITVKHPSNTVIVLNSGNLAGRAAQVVNTDPRFAETEQVIFWAQNDAAGQAAVLSFGEAMDHGRYTLGTMEHYYEGFKDLNDFWMNTDSGDRLRVSAAFRKTEPTRKVFDASPLATMRRSDNLKP